MKYNMMDKFDTLLKLTAWKYDDQVGIDDKQQEESRILYDELADFIMTYQDTVRGKR